MSAIVHSVEEIEAMLRRGLSPLTDNREALLALGFDRAYPQVNDGYDATIWERAIQHRSAHRDRRALIRERAILQA